MTLHYTVVAHLHHVVDTGINAVSIFLNALLIYLVLTHSDFREKTYKWLLLVSGIIDFLLSIFAFIAQPIFIPSGDYCVVASNGYSKAHAYSFNAMMLTGYFGTLHASSVWTAVQFVFRKNLLCASEHEQTTRLVVKVGIFTLLWAISGYTVHALVFSLPTDIVTAREVLQNNSWPATVAEGGPAAPYVYQLGNPLWTIFIFTWTSTSCFGFSLIIWSEIRIAQHYREVGDQLRIATRHLHAEIHRALLAMAICPVITSDVPVLYLMAALVFKWHPGAVSAFVETSTSSITFWNPVMTIMCIRCYRIVFTGPVTQVIERICKRAQVHHNAGGTMAAVSGMPSVSFASHMHVSRAGHLAQPIPSIVENA